MFQFNSNLCAYLCKLTTIFLVFVAMRFVLHASSDKMAYSVIVKPSTYHPRNWECVNAFCYIWFAVADRIVHAVLMMTARDETMVSFTEKTTENAHISFNYTGKVVWTLFKQGYRACASLARGVQVGLKWNNMLWGFLLRSEGVIYVRVCIYHSHTGRNIQTAKKCCLQQTMYALSTP